MSGHSKVGYEKRDVNVLKIMLVSIVPALAMVLSIIGLHYLFKVSQVSHEIAASKADTREIEKIRSLENTALTNYKSLGGDVYQIPIAQAMEIVIDQNVGRGSQ